ncbi:MAG TPA: DUF6677 family protein [Thermoanaerobaculia bacterium]
MSSPAPDSGSRQPGSRSGAAAYVAALLALLVPGAGHFYLRRWGRGAIFLVLVLAALAVGVALDGRLPWYWTGPPLKRLATLGAMGSGLPPLILHFVLGYQGDLRGSGWEYGGVFIVTAGLMNLLLVLDAWDIAAGRKD